MIRRRLLTSPLLVLAVVLGITHSIGFGPVTTKAHAAGYCNIYPPSRIAVWEPSDDVTYTLTYGSGCRVSGVAWAGWRGLPSEVSTPGWWYAVDPETGEPNKEPFTEVHRLDLGYPRGSVVEWVPVGAEDRNGEPALQNRAATTIKSGSVSYIAAKRSGGYHEVTARAYHYSLSSDAIVPSGSRPGQVQFREPGSTIWRPVAGVKLGGNGQTTIRTWSPGPRYYRVSFGEQPTIFATISAEVRAR